MEQPFRLMDITALETAGTRGSLASQLDRMLHSSTSWDARVSKMIFDTGEYEIVLRGAIQSDPTADAWDAEAAEAEEPIAVPVVVDAKPAPADETIAAVPSYALIPGRL